ncbi:MAG: biotin/lipoyl-binding protein [Deltaproteobacteria bacterium]|nr:biotin/lipoyl-binding protein [Deltaproteobacteria bacterium]
MTKEKDYRVLGPGHYSLLVHGLSYEVFVRSGKKGYLVEVGGHSIPVFLGDSTGKGNGEEPNGSAEIISPMPGRVIGIKKKEGEEVRSGEGVLVVEAMKMENELVSSRSGRVVKIHVVVGDRVESGQVLARIE